MARTLIACGADIQYKDYSGDVDAQRGLIDANTRGGPIARCLVCHGADVNAIYASRSWSEQFGSYWMNVVESGDIAWAAELLTKYGANANRPLRGNVGMKTPA